MALKLGVNLRTVPVTANYAITVYDDVINVNSLSGAVQLTLFDATLAAGKVVIVSKISTDTNIVSVVGTGGQTIDGFSTVGIYSQNETLQFASLNGVWISVGLGWRESNTLHPARNHLVNGNFDFWQRGTSFTFTGSTLDTAYTADRWKIWAGGSENDTISRVSGSIQGASFGLKWIRNSGNANTGGRWISQVIESKNAAKLAGKVVTLSFRAKCGTSYSASSSSLTSVISTATGTDESYSGAWTGGVDQIQNNALTTTFQRFTQTVLLPSTTNEIAISFKVNPTGTSGVDDSFILEQVMLNEGNIAAPFSISVANVAHELEICQRYCYSLNGNGDGSSGGIVSGQGLCNSGTNCYIPYLFPQVMRAVPTLNTTTVGNFRVNQTAGQFAVISVATYQNSRYGQTVIWGTASGLTANAPGWVNAVNATDYIWFDADF